MTAVVALRTLGLAAGLVTIGLTVASAIRTVVLPRAIPARLTRVVFLSVRFLFQVRAGRNATYARRDELMASYGPLALLALLLAWLLLIGAGYFLVFWSIADRPVEQAYVLAGSSLFTLGFERPADVSSLTASFTASALGLFLLALMITYLPTLYAAFSRRETAVAALEIRAGSPPSGVTLLQRFWRLQRIDKLTAVWEQWELWFVELEETHTTYSALNFFRSPQPDHSWVTAAGAVLDGAALLVSSVDTPHDVTADMCIRAGYLALRRIASFFRIAFDPDPRPDDPISIGRDEFDAALEVLASEGVPLKADREQAWRDFRGWRVNYDSVLLSMATLTMAPYAPWSSDRSLAGLAFTSRFQRLAVLGLKPGPHNRLH